MLLKGLLRHVHSAVRVARPAVGLVAFILVLPAGAWGCTDTWTGGAEGEWQVGANWSTGKVPSSSDVACVGVGDTVKVTEGTNQAGVLRDEGTLVILAGTLELTSAAEASSTVSLTMTNGTLSGAGTLNISSALTTDGSSTMRGSGATVVQSGASAAIDTENFTYLSLIGRSFVNEGTATFSHAYIYESEGALITNSGMFKANSEGYIGILSEGPGSIVNTGTFEKTEGASATKVEPAFENLGTVQAQTGKLSFGGEWSGAGGSGTGSWSASEGASIVFSGGSFSLTGGSFVGQVEVAGAVVAVEGVTATSAQITVASGSLSIKKGSMTVPAFTQTNGTLTGAGTLNVSSSLTTDGGSKMTGTGATVVQPGAMAAINTENLTYLQVVERLLVNEGTATFSHAQIYVEEGGEIKNAGTFKVSSEGAIVATKGSAFFVNSGLFEKTETSSTMDVEPDFENLGSIKEEAGHFEIRHPVSAAHSTQYGGSENASAPGQQRPSCGDPVNCATGNLSESQTDLAVGGRGVGLQLTRTYNSQAAAEEGTRGSFGYGWSGSFSDHLVVEKANKKATLYQADGSTVPFTEGGGKYTAPAWSQDTLGGNSEAGYTVGLADQTVYKFKGSNGRLESVTDRNGNATTLSYSGAGRLETITDPAGRKITLVYNSEGLVESAKDPMGHVVKYTYESGNLASVTEPGESSARWQFKYDGSHEITTVTDGRGGKTVNEYNGSHQVTSQKDPAEHTLTFEYEPFHTKITNTTTGSVTDERFTSNDLPYAVTRGYGTSSATTETFTYDTSNNLLSVTDGNGHTTKYAYDGQSNRTSMVDPEKDETTWTYDSTHDVKTMTTPNGETTTIKRDSRGNAETIERPAPAGKTQTIKYKYDAHGEVTSVTNPLEHAWKYAYDNAGDRTAETDAEAAKRTWEYNEDSQPTAIVSPKGNINGAEATRYTTKIERDEQGRSVKVTDPLGHTIKYAYDGDGNLETLTDGNGHKTTYTYNADNQPTKVKEPNGIVTETEYDGAGHVIGQTDGNKHTTKYVRNAVGEVTEITDSAGRKTTKEYDLAGKPHEADRPRKTLNHLHLRCG